MHQNSHVCHILFQRTYDIDIDTDPYADYDVAKSDPGWVRSIGFFTSAQIYSYAEWAI